MCKIMIIPKVKNSNKAMQFMKAAVPKMSESDNDGLGYAAIHADGDITIERWLNPKDAFKVRENTLSDESNALASISQCIEDYSPQSYSNEGPSYESSPVRSLIYHTRMATCQKNLANVHPFVRAKTVLVHNGVIQNPEVFPPINSTCDSEAILNGYVDLDIANAPEAIQELSDKLQGYFATAVFSQREDKTYVLDIVRDNRASLNVGYVKELKTEVFCTDPKILKQTCKRLGWHVGAIHSLLDNVFIRYNAITGLVIETLEFARSHLSVTTRSSLGSLASAYSMDEEEGEDKDFRTLQYTREGWDL